MKILLKTKESSNLYEYPDAIHLFSGEQVVIEGTKDLVTSYRGSKSLIEMSDIVGYEVKEFTGDVIPEDKVRIITTGAMQSRFAISEEVAINEGTDAICKVLLSRLLNAKNIDLDLEEFVSGLAYVVTWLDSIGMVLGGVTVQERLLTLAKDGTADEAYH